MPASRTRRPGMAEPPATTAVPSVWLSAAYRCRFCCRTHAHGTLGHRTDRRCHASTWISVRACRSGRAGLIGTTRRVPGRDRTLQRRAAAALSSSRLQQGLWSWVGECRSGMSGALKCPPSWFGSVERTLASEPQRRSTRTGTGCCRRSVWRWRSECWMLSTRRAVYRREIHAHG